jgi:stage V sporulation protein B
MKIFLIVLPGLIFTSVYSVIRGVFWGDKDFLPYSIIELLEELCMITVGIILIERATDIYDGAVKAGVAVLISYFFSFSLATAVFFIRKHHLTNPKSQFKPLLFSALPITAMRTANSLSVSLVSILLPLRLVSAGMTNTEAMSASGSAMGQAIPLLFIPTTLIGSFTLVLVPEISENYYKKRFFYLKRDVEKAIKFTTFLTCLFIPVFFVCGEEIGVLVFNSHQCGKYLTASAFLMLFMGLSSVTTSVLNSMGLENLTLLFFVISSAFMLLCVWFLPQVVGIYALLIGFTFVYGLTTVLNLLLLKKKCPHALEYKKMLCFSVLFLFPSALIGGMLEKMLLPILGTLLTFLSVSAIMIIFNALLFIGFNIIPLKKIILFSSKRKTLKKVST